MWFQHLLLFEMKATVKQWCLSLSDFLVMWMASGLSHYRIQAKQHLCWQSAFIYWLSERMRSYCIGYQRYRMGWICWVSGYYSRWQECFLSFPGLQVGLVSVVHDSYYSARYYSWIFVFVIAWVTWPQMCNGIGNSKCRVCAGRMHLCCISFV